MRRSSSRARTRSLLTATFAALSLCTDASLSPRLAPVAFTVLATPAAAQTSPAPRTAERGPSEIHVFLAEARAQPENLSYRQGQTYDLLIMLRQARASEPDWQGARAFAEAAGWYDVKLSKATIVDPSVVARQRDEVVEAYRRALEHGRALIVFTDSRK